MLLCSVNSISQRFLSKQLSKIYNQKLLQKFSTSSNLKQLHDEKNVEKTALYDFHVKNNGKMVNFAGFLLPVQYSDMSLSASHLHTRKFASIFDVSHMLQSYIRGKHSIECFESICTADIKGLPDGHGTLTVFTSEKGTILDDLIVTKESSDTLYVVSNAAMKKQDIAIMMSAVSSFKRDAKDVEAQFLTPESHALLAVQGPTAVQAVQKLTDGVNLSKLYFMTSCVAKVAGVHNCRITRCGYTGEDGVEISVPAKDAEHVAEALLSDNESNVKLAGLGARDSLRLEAGLCLYGSDIDASTTPVEAALNWLVGKRRRQEANFPGAEIINNQFKNGVDRRRVGIRMKTGPPARSGSEIFINNEKVGCVTSGCPSPSLGGNIAMGYIHETFKTNGTKVNLKIRDKFYPGEITKMPFIPSKYYTKPK